MNRRAFIVGSSLASLAACGRSASDRLEMSIVAVSQEMDPYVAPNLESAELSWLYADGLSGADLSRPEIGSLCVRPAVRTVVAGVTSYAYELRGGVRWHDGKPLSARDVAGCFTRLRASSWAHQRPFSLVDRIDVHDGRRFTVILTQDDPRFPSAFFTPIGSPGVPLVRAGRVPIGTGPFRLRDRLADAWTCERWEGSPRGTPAIRQLRLSYLADDRTQEILLASGETDVALFLAGAYLREHQLPYFRRRSGVVYAIVNSTGTLAQTPLREAFAAAIDRHEIASKIYRNTTSEYDSVVMPTVAGSGIPLAHAYDPAYAARIFRTRATAPIDIAVTPGSLERIGLLIQARLSAVGAKATVRNYTEQLFLAPEGPLRSGHFDVAIFGEYFSPDPDLTATWGCSARAPNGGNFSRLCDPQLDRLASSGDYRGALSRLRQQAVVVPLVDSVIYVGLSKRVRGAENARDMLPTVFGAADWRIV
jgi:peptide/nickel transport system substrate-binding protein